MHDIMTGAKSIGEARGYYAKEFVDCRRKKPTPYPERLRLRPADGSSTDPDERVLSGEDLRNAKEAGRGG
jgi:hypothetical protein